jgi:hypothetical protein
MMSWLCAHACMPGQVLVCESVHLAASCWDLAEPPWLLQLVPQSLCKLQC